MHTEVLSVLFLSTSTSEPVGINEHAMSQPSNQIIQHKDYEIFVHVNINMHIYIYIERERYLISRGLQA